MKKINSCNGKNAMSAKASFGDLLNNIVIASNVAWVSMLTGIFTAYEVFSVHAGPLASLAGFLLSLVLIYVNIQNVKINNLQIQKLQRREDDKRELKAEAKKTAVKRGLDYRFWFLLLFIVAVVLLLLFYP